MTPIREDDFIASVADALQYIAVYHPPSFVRALAEAHAVEESPAARDALRQILVNSRMAAFGRRPICQDTGVVNAFVKVGMGARIETARTLQDLVDEGVRRAYGDPDNPLRASMVRDPLEDRRNTGDNTPAVVHVEMVAGDAIAVTVAAKGGGSENKARFVNLAPAASCADWWCATVETLGAGWCPPGLLGIGVGGSAEKSMVLAKEALLQPIDMPALLARGAVVETRGVEDRDLRPRQRARHRGAGLGGLTTVVDVKVKSFPCHAASKPVGLIPQCAADRYITFTLDGSGPARFAPPDIELWPDLGPDRAAAPARRVDLDRLTRAEVATWRAGETLLLSGRMLTGRDAAHKRMSEMMARGEPLPVDLRDRAIYYVGPVDAVRDEAVGPAGPTTATRMDGFTDALLERTGLLVMIGKAERGADTVASIARHGAAYLVAVGGAAYLVSKAVKSARVLAFADLGMEAIHEFTVEDMPVTVAVDSTGSSIHRTGPTLWRRPPVVRTIAVRSRDSIDPDLMTLLLNIDVPDVDAAQRFYCAAFGLTLGRRFGADFVELLGWPVPVYLLAKDTGTTGAGADLRRYDRHWTPVHADVVVDDLDLAIERAVGAGATLEHPAREASYGRIAMLADPYGHGFCLIAFNAEGYDAIVQPRPGAS